MPYSSESGKSFVRYIFGKVKSDRILDVGCGSGTYAKMFLDKHFTGIEVWGPYVEQFGLNGFYKELYLEDARTIEWDVVGSDGKFDIAILGDILEHMTEEEAKSLFDNVRKYANTVIVSIPIGHYPQDEFQGNPYEKHVTDNWSVEDVHRVFGKPDFGRQDKEIGVFVWSDQPVKPKICVYAISKNEVGFVQRFVESAIGADHIMIADTGSTDGTAEKARIHGATVHSIYINPWRFDHARNAALSLIPADIDICISLDLDEVMEPGWREEIERVWEPGVTTRLRYMFDWGCGIKFQYEKIHHRKGYHWHHPCHEYPRPDGRTDEIYAYTNKLLVSHHPDPTKSRGQYLDLLKLSVNEDPHCPRNAFYYARELMFHRDWLNSIKECERYLALPGATWMNERCYAYRVMGKCYDEMFDHKNAEMNYMKAASEAPNTREPWCELAMLMYRQARWAECFAYSMKALEITNRELVYTCDPAVWGHWAHDLASIAAWNLGLKQIALEQAKWAVGLSPNDERLKGNLEMIEKDLSSTIVAA
jgi:glycosyltransferase involved in cell wall biosynthesis